MNRETGGSTVVAGSTLRKHKASKHKNWVLLQNAHPQGGLNDDYVFLGRAVDRICIRFHVLLKYRIVKRELSNFELAACSPRANPFGQIRCSGKPLTDSDQSAEMIRLSKFCRWMMTNLLMTKVVKVVRGWKGQWRGTNGSRKGQRGKITNELKELVIKRGHKKVIPMIWYERKHQNN